MRRRNALKFGNKAQENQDSDQSISEEEEGLEGDGTGSTITLGGAGDKGKTQVLSQLEILRDSYEPHSTEEESISSDERKGGYHADNEVPNPLFFGVDSSNCSPRIKAATHAHSNEEIVYLPSVASVSHFDEEVISDDEEINPPMLRSARKNVGGTSREASRKVEALVWLNEYSSHTSHGVIMKENKLSRGGGDQIKAKPKFKFRSHSHTRDIVSDRNGKTSSNNIPASEGMNKFMAESWLIFHEKESKQPEIDIVPSELGYKHDFKEHSMAEFLDCFHMRSDPLQGSSEMGSKNRGRREQTVLSRNVSLLGDRDLEDGELAEALDDPFSSDDEENPQAPKSNFPRTIVDQFHEAFGVGSEMDKRPYIASSGPSCGIHRKLQQVMLIEKDRDMDYLKNINVETSFNDERSIAVRILSSYLEAKLIVCSCTSVEDGKKSYWENNLQTRMKKVATTLSVIFNPRICSDVELEEGNLIRIHPPWKEVLEKGKDEVILLCSYFSQIQT